MASPRWIVAGVTALAVYNAAIGLLASERRDGLLESALHEAEVAAGTLSYEIETSLDTVDRTLSGVVEVMRAAPPRLTFNNPDAHRLLLRRHAITPQLKTLFLVGDDGRLLTSSSSSEVPPVDLSDRDYVQAHQTAIRDRMFIGIPVQSRLTSEWVLPVSRAVEDQFGGLRAVAGGGIDPDYMHDLIVSHRLPPGFRTAVLLPNGGLAACDGVPGCVLGAKVAAGPFEGEEGGGLHVAFLPGGEGPGAFVRGDRYDVVTAVMIDRPSVLAPWWEMVPVFVGLSVVGSSAIAIGLIVLRRQMLARMAAMTALAQANADLEARVAERTRELSESEERLRSFIRAALDAVVIIDGTGMVTEFNPAAGRLFGYDPSEVIGRSVNMLMPDSYAQDHDRHVAASSAPVQRPVGRERQMVGRRKNGGEFPIELTVGTRVLDGKVIHVGVIRDITERKANEESLRRLANTDGLTGVFNRRSFMEEGERLFAIAQRHGRQISVLMIDADHFKAVNDTHGHDIGDVVLKKLTQVIASRLRDTDVLGRLGGEEFAVVLPETDRAGAEMAGWMVVEAVRAAVVALPDGGELRFTVSIGVGARDEACPSLHQMLKDADTALYRAKKDGRNRVVDFVPDGTAPG